MTSEVNISYAYVFVVDEHPEAGGVLGELRRGHDRPEELCHDPHHLHRAAPAEGAPAGGDARANVRLQTAQERSSGNVLCHSLYSKSFSITNDIFSTSFQRKGRT